MNQQTTILTAEFPRAVRGYATVAVDDFVRQIGDRLDSLQDSLNAQTERAEKAARDLDQASKELAAFREKESALAGALVSIEQQRSGVRGELEAERKKAGAEANRILVVAREEAETVLAGARNEAEQINLAANSQVRAAEEQVSAMQSHYNHLITDIRRTLDTFRSTLPDADDFSGDLTAGGMPITAVVDPGRSTAVLAEAA